MVQEPQSTATADCSSRFFSVLFLFISVTFEAVKIDDPRTQPCSAFSDLKKHVCMHIVTVVWFTDDLKRKLRQALPLNHMEDFKVISSEDLVILRQKNSLEVKGAVPAWFTFITRMSLAILRRFQRITVEVCEWAALKACQQKNGKYCCVTSHFSLTLRKIYTDTFQLGYTWSVDPLKIGSRQMSWCQLLLLKVLFGA